MQVAHQEDFVTHAVIGGGATIDFGISNSAEFFNILSSTLYKDQILAVVREVLCNAWDAHIDAGCTDKPIVVTLSDNTLTVKDSGKGIHHDDIGIVYGTYGNSTKKNDGKQTGGFGLGCKAPFAYTDHFEVVSSHGGVRTIYAMSKSSAQVGGKPGITSIAQFATEETGLSVSIKIKSSDSARFSQLIKRIAYNGDMNVQFNNEQMPTIEFDTGKNNWLILKNKDSSLVDSPDRFQLLVRYGNVIYPIDFSQKELIGKADEIQRIIGVLADRYSYSYFSVTLLFQAPSHSISVTPSRESLSMQEHTVATIDRLFTEFLDQVSTSYEDRKQANLIDIIATEVANKNVSKLVNAELVLPNFDTGANNKSLRITTVDELAKTYLSIHYPATSEFRKFDVTLRVKEMSKAGLIPQGLASTYLKDVAIRPESDNLSVRYSKDGTQWLQRHVISKLLTKLMKANLSTSSLRVFDSNMDTVRSDGMSKATAAKPRSIYNCLPYLRNIIVLTGSSNDIQQRVKDAHNKPTQTAYLSGFLFYVFGRKKGEKEAAQEFFTKSGMTVIDLSILEAANKPVAVKTVAPATPRLKGLPLLSSAASTTSKRIWFPNVKLVGALRTEEPKFVIRQLTSDTDNRVAGHYTAASNALFNLFGEDCGVCTTTPQYSSWKKKVPGLEEYVYPKVMEFVKNSPEIQKQLANSPLAVQQYIDSNPSFGRSYSISSLTSHGIFVEIVGITTVLTEVQEAYMTLYYYYLSNSDAFTKMVGDLAATPLCKEYKTIIDKAAKSTLLPALDMSNLARMLRTPATKQKALNLFNHALNN